MVKGDKKREYKRHSRSNLNRKHISERLLLNKEKKNRDLADLMMEKTINQHLVPTDRTTNYHDR
jgi:hypothetical protein